MSRFALFLAVVGLVLLWHFYPRGGGEVPAGTSRLAAPEIPMGISRAGEDAGPSHTSAAIKEGDQRLAYLADAIGEKPIVYKGVTISKKAVVDTIAKSFLKNHCFSNANRCKICCASTAKAMPFPGRFNISSCEKFCTPTVV